jgi:aspartyl-tRNA synthetase
MRVLASDIGQQEGKKVLLMGWVNVRRDHGKIIFIDLRDRTGIAQVIFLGKDKNLFNLASQLRPEWVVKISGAVNKRPDNLINNDIPSGQWEILAESLEILNEAKTLPIGIEKDGYEIGEESRLKYRYLDLRRQRLQKNLKTRHKVIQFIREYLSDGHGFIEIETPIISKSTPEGARDYLVPSRIYPKKFFALPQSPQQYKQLLMVAGFERYFQIARCFRDEDTRGDRQPEFTQLDLEMSFVERDQVMELIENLYAKIVEKLFPEKKIIKKPFPQLTYKEAIGKYETDRPDLRSNKNNINELAFCWVIDFPFFEPIRSDSGQVNGYTFTHNPFSAPKKEYFDQLLTKNKIGEILTSQYDLVLNGHEVGGGSIRNHQSEALKKVFEIIGLSEEKIKDNFGHMLEALSFGAPPHGGIAMGLDRLMAILMNEPNIREVIAFPKTGDARDLMMNAPSEVDKRQLDELELEIKKSLKS